MARRRSRQLGALEGASGTLLTLAAGAGLVWWLMRRKPSPAAPDMANPVLTSATVRSGGYVGGNSYGMPMSKVRDCVAAEMRRRGLMTDDDKIFSDDASFVDYYTAKYQGLAAACTVIQ